MTTRLPAGTSRPPTRWTLILRARKLRRLYAELLKSANQAQITPAELNVIRHANSGLYNMEFILSATARRVNQGKALGRGFAQGLGQTPPPPNDNSPTEQQS